MRPRYWHVVVGQMIQEAIERSGLRARRRPVWAAEIGIAYGHCSAYLLRTIPDLHLYMVDPWTAFPDYVQAEAPGYRQKDFDQQYRATLEITEPYAGRRHVLRGTSASVAHLVADASLVLAFIDGDHRFETCHSDILTYWPKILPGGILCGHDYGRHRPGVIQAVDKWAMDTHTTITLAGRRNRVWSTCKPL